MPTKNKTWGICYQGSKSKIAEWVVSVLPPAAHLYDVFGGGGAVADCALQSGKWEHVYCSDVTDSVLLFEQAFKGALAGREREWISRDDFYKRKDTDPYVKWMWSFGNDGQSYMYSREVEPVKKAIHDLIYGETPSERRLLLKPFYKELKARIEKGGTKGFDRGVFIQSASQAEQAIRCSDEYFKRLQSAERADRLSCRVESAERADRLSCRVCDYRDVEILPGSVIYCDPPYANTKTYAGIKFDFEEFYKWCESQTQPVFISEYWMPEDRFICIAEKPRKSKMCATKSTEHIERIFVPKGQGSLIGRVDIK